MYILVKFICLLFPVIQQNFIYITCFVFTFLLWGIGISKLLPTVTFQSPDSFCPVVAIVPKVAFISENVCWDLHVIGLRKLPTLFDDEPFYSTLISPSSTRPRKPSAVGSCTWCLWSHTSTATNYSNRLAIDFNRLFFFFFFGVVHFIDIKFNFLDLYKCSFFYSQSVLKKLMYFTSGGHIFICVTLICSSIGY